MLFRPAWKARWFPELSPNPPAPSRTQRATFMALELSRTPCLGARRSSGSSKPTSVSETSSWDPSPCLCLSHRPRRSVTSATTLVPLYPYISRWLGQPQVASRSLSSCSRCPLRLFPFPTGRLRRKLWQEGVAFPPTSNTGAHTVSCGLRHFRLDWASDNQSSPYTTCLIGLWPLVLGLHRPCSQHAIVPSDLSTEGQLLVYPLRFSGLTPTGERGSCATWAQYYDHSVTLHLAVCRRSLNSSKHPGPMFRSPLRCDPFLTAWFCWEDCRATRPLALHSRHRVPGWFPEG
jgi:hypothetical protein